MAQHAQAEGMLGRAVREALEAVLSPGLAAEVLDAALRLAREQVIPEDPSRVRRFVDGPLSLSLHRHASLDVAACVVDQLEPILRMACGDAQPAAMSRPTARVGPVSSPVAPYDPFAEPQPFGEWEEDDVTPTHVAVKSGPIPVLMATMDRSNMAGVARLLGTAVEVRHVADIYELLVATHDLGRRRYVVVLDCCTPSVDARALARMLGTMPRRARFVLWGAPDSVAREVEEIAPRPGGWTRLAADASQTELAELLYALIGR